MVAFDAAERLTPFRDAAGGYGAILFDATRMRQAEPGWFSPAAWNGDARPVGHGGRGGAWFIDAQDGHPVRRAVLRQYLRGGLVAAFNRETHLWRGIGRVRSFEEFRLTRELHGRGLPVPQPLAAQYLRSGLGYRAAILLDRIEGVRSLGDRVGVAGEGAPWEEAGRLVARFHRAGLDHADLNAHNLLFDTTGQGWMIDFDRCSLRIPATAWREGNLSRLRRSLLKLRGERSEQDVLAGYARLRAGYDSAWNRGY